MASSSGTTLGGTLDSPSMSHHTSRSGVRAVFRCVQVRDQMRVRIKVRVGVQVEVRVGVKVRVRC